MQSTTTSLAAVKRRRARRKTRRLGGLTRYSQLGQRDPEHLQTLPVQHERLEAAVEADPEWSLGLILDEEQVSGRAPLSRRPKLTQLLEMVENDELDDILVVYFDRAFRSTAVKKEVVDRLEAVGGRLLTLDMGAISHATAIQWMTSEVITVFNEYFARAGAERSAAAQERAIREGVAIMRVVPPGYRKGPDKKLYVVEEEAEIVRQAFELRAGGASLAQVRDFLAEHGIQRTVGGVRSMLKLRVFLGELHFGELVNREAHPAIMGEALWLSAQRAEAPRGRIAKQESLLAKLGVLACGSCDRLMAISHTRRGSDYRCPHNNSGLGDCPRPVHARAHIVERVVLADLQQRVGRRVKGRASAGVEVDESREAWQAAEAALAGAIRKHDRAGTDEEDAAVEEIRDRRVERDEAKDTHERLARAAARSRTVNLVDDLGSMTVAERRAAVAAYYERITLLPSIERGRVRLACKVFPEQAAGDPVEYVLDSR